MKIIALGDTHGRQYWKYVVNTQEFDKIVFIGDYFDSWDISGKDQINNFLDIIEYKKNNPDKIILLIGNHDHHYFSSIGYTGTSGYQQVMAPSINTVIEDNKDHLQMAYSHENLLFTHAGVGETFMDIAFGKEEWKVENIADDLNELWKHKPHAFTFNGRDSSGDNIGQTPIWIRPRSLMKDSHNLKKEIIQIVGHTGQVSIDIKGKSTNGRYYLIDTLGSSKEYLIWDDGEFKTDKI